jgi:hypothetical protein
MASLTVGQPSLIHHDNRCEMARYRTNNALTGLLEEFGCVGIVSSHDENVRRDDKHVKFCDKHAGAPGHTQRFEYIFSCLSSMPLLARQDSLQEAQRCYAQILKRVLDHFQPVNTLRRFLQHTCPALAQRSEYLSVQHYVIQAMFCGYRNGPIKARERIVVSAMHVVRVTLYSKKPGGSDRRSMIQPDKRRCLL